MKILHVVYALNLAEFRGGVSKVVWELARAQVVHGHAVSIYTVCGGGERPREAIVEGVVIRHFRRRLFPELYSTDLGNALRAHVSEFDLVHSHNTFLSLNRQVSSICRSRNIPYFLHPHGALDKKVVRRGLIKYAKKWLYINLVELRCLNRASGVFAITEEECEQLVLVGVKSPIYVVPNGVSISAPPPRSETQAWLLSRKIPPLAKRVVYVGRFHPKKRLDLLLLALNELLKKGLDVVVLLGGDRQQFLEHVSMLDALVSTDAALRERIIWLGFLNETEKIKALAVADAFYHVSESEGMAISILEAMGMRLPVVVGAGCNMGNAVKAGAALESSYSSESVAESLGALLSDSALQAQVSARAAEYVRRFHDWSIISKHIEEFYRRGLSGARLK